MTRLYHDTLGIREGTGRTDAALNVVGRMRRSGRGLSPGRFFNSIPGATLARHLREPIPIAPPAGRAFGNYPSPNRANLFNGSSVDRALLNFLAARQPGSNTRRDSAELRPVVRRRLRHVEHDEVSPWNDHRRRIRTERPENEA